jgi:hypothetical protein
MVNINFYLLNDEIFCRHNDHMVRPPHRPCRTRAINNNHIPMNFPQSSEEVPMALVLQLILIILCVSSHASNFCDLPNRQDEQNNLQSIEDLLCQLDDGGDKVSYKNCPESEMDLLRRSTQRAVEMTDSLLANFRRLVGQFHIENERIHRAVNKLECVQRKLKGGTIKCMDLGGDLGYAIPILGSGVAIDLDAHRKDIPQFHWTHIDLADFIGSTILHEMTHKCGTGDGAYFNSWKDNLREGLSNWANNADTYQNMALFGFCIPGPQCASRPAPKK